VLDKCYLIEDPETGEAFVHGILVDITSRKRLEADLREMSTRDALTGALNRRYLFDLEERFAADPELRCGCIFIDIDNFKKYNDLHGHQEGDDVLKRMTRFLMRCTRAEEAVVRIGGDEFVVILNNAESDETRRVAERLRTEAETQMPISFSLGWATREKGEPVQRLLDRADHGLLEVRVVKRQSDPRMIALAR
jgi:diguanylate cyclase (GGDEF)-like protein